MGAEILGLITLLGRRGLPLKRKIVHGVDGWRAGGNRALFPQPQPGSLLPQGVGSLVLWTLTSQPRPLHIPVLMPSFIPRPCLSNALSRGPYWPGQVSDNPSSDYYVPGTTPTRLPWERDHVLPEARGCS